jgi:hypothetical protein
MNGAAGDAGPCYDRPDAKPRRNQRRHHRPPAVGLVCAHNLIIAQMPRPGTGTGSQRSCGDLGRESGPPGGPLGRDGRVAIGGGGSETSFNDGLCASKWVVFNNRAPGRAV